MEIPEKVWKEYVKRLRRLDQAAADVIQRWMDRNPGADVQDLITVAYAAADKYGNASAALACEMYDALAEAQGAELPPAEPAETATFGETAKAVRGTMKNQRNSVPDTVGRLVKQAGADTIVQNAKRDGAEWAWIPAGSETCAFCITLASRGWQRQGKRAAEGDHAEHIHPHCDCQYAVRFDGKSTVAGYDPEKYLRMYEDAEGLTPEEKINAMRRALYAENKDRINGQKRIAYRTRQELETIVKVRRTGLAKGVELPRSLREAKNIPEDIKQGISNAIDRILERYDVQIGEIEYAPYHESASAPFTFIPFERRGKYYAKLNINSLFDWNESIDSFNDRIYNRNYQTGILASKNLDDLIKHECAHFMTFQDCVTWRDFLQEEKRVRSRFILGVSGYSDSTEDGAETIAEGFVRMENGDRVDEAVKMLVEQTVGRHRK